MMMNKKFSRNEYLSYLVSVIFLCIPLFPLLGLESRQRVDNFTANRLSVQNGLPQNTVYDIVQDQEGYIWVGTDDGLYRTDGVSGNTYHTGNTAAIKNNSITALCAAQDGTLWIGTFGGGILLYRNNVFLSYTNEKGRLNDFIRIMIQDSQANIWAGTAGGGLYRFNSDGFKAFGVSQGLSGNTVNALWEDHNGTLWIGTDNGLNTMKPEDNLIHSNDTGLNGNEITALYEDENRILWIGTSNGLISMKGNKQARYTTDNGLTHNAIRFIRQDRDHNLWVATENGLNLITGTEPRLKDIPKIEPYSFGENGPANSLQRLYVDGENNLWVGTKGEGCYILHRKQVMTYTTENGLSHNTIKAIYQDSSGSMWIGTNGGGVNLMKGSRIHHFSSQNGLAGDSVNTILQDKQKTLWIGTETGLSAFSEDTGTFKNYTKSNGLSSPAIGVLYEDRGGTLWIGTYGGGLHYLDKQRNHFSCINMGNGLSNHYILCLAEDDEKNLWVGTNNGLNRIRNNRVEGYPQFKRFSGVMIFDIYPDPEGTVWVATNSSGLFRLKDDQVDCFTTGDGLISDTIYRMIPDDKGNLWLSSNRGIFSLELQELNQMKPRHHSFLTCTYFAEEDGMGSSVCTGGSQPSGIKSLNGLLWFPTLKGVAILDPSVRRVNTQEPPVYIKHLIADGIHYSPGGSIHLPKGTNEIRISFTALSFTIPSKVRFRYRLKESDLRWKQVQSGREVIFRGLGAGRYTFELSASNNDGLWSRKNGVVEFRIAHPFYATFWFYFIIAIGLAAITILIYMLPRFREMRRLEAEQKYQASPVTEPRSRNYSYRILKFMKEEKPYLDPDLTAASLAEMMGIPLKHLSQVVNQQLNKNFKNFINEYRIEEAKQRILDPKEQDFVLLKIALDVGFNSKSVFNAAFKKFTGLTPSEYRKQHMKKPDAPDE